MIKHYDEAFVYLRHTLNWPTFDIYLDLKMNGSFVRVHGGVTVEGSGAYFAEICLPRHSFRMLPHQMLLEASFGQDGVAKMTLLKVTLHLLPSLVVVEVVGLRLGILRGIVWSENNINK